MKKSPPARVLRYSDLREYFQDIYRCSKTKNPRLTQAAFAKHLGVSASAWSNYLESRRELSEKALLEIARRLKWDAEELAHALSLRAFHATGEFNGFSTELKARAETRSRAAIREVKAAEALEMDLNLVSLVLIESIKLPEYAKNPAGIAERMNLDPVQFAKTLARLVERGVLGIDGDGAYFKTGQPLLIVAETTQPGIRQFHKQMLDATSRRIRAENADRRYLGCETFALNDAMLPEAKRIVDRCLDELAALAYRCDSPDTVFHAGLQLVELLEKKNA